MAKDKNSFILYADYIHTVEHLTDEQAGILFKHILEYVNDRHPTTPNIYVNLAFEPIKQQLKRDLKKYETKRENYSKSGQEGNLKRWNLPIYTEYKAGKISLEEALLKASHRHESPPDESRSQPVAFVAVNDNVTVNDNIINKKENILKENAYNFLKENSPEELQTFEMQNKKSILDYKAFIEFFNNKVEVEELKFKPSVLFGRLKILRDNWKNDKNNSHETKQTITNLANEVRSSKLGNQKRTSLGPR